MARTNRLLLATAGTVAVLAVSLVPSTSAPLAPAITSTERFAYPAALQDGDVIFRLGKDALAALVLAQTNGARYSHVGMIIQTAGAWSVIHSTPAEPGVAGGVQAERLDDFASPEVAAKLAFFRVEGLTDPQRLRAREYLLSQIGKPFDYRFEYSDDSAQYCTELVLKAMRSAGLDLEPSMGRVQVITLPEAAIPPDSLLVSPKLREMAPNPPIKKSTTAGQPFTHALLTPAHQAIQHPGEQDSKEYPWLDAKKRFS